MKKIISIFLSIVIIIITVIGLVSHISFKEWLPYDIVIALLLFINSTISYSKNNDGEANINLILPCIMIAAFFMHFTFTFWIIIDLAIVFGSVYSIYRVSRLGK